MTPDEYTALADEVKSAQAAAISFSTRLVAGEKIDAEIVSAAMLRLNEAGQALHKAVTVSALLFAAEAMEAMPVARNGRLVL